MLTFSSLLLNAKLRDSYSFENFSLVEGSSTKSASENLFEICLIDVLIFFIIIMMKVTIQMQSTADEDFIKLSTFLTQNRMKFQVDFEAHSSLTTSNADNGDCCEKRRCSSENDEDGAGKRAKFEIKNEAMEFVLKQLANNADYQQENISQAHYFDDEPPLTIYEVEKSCSNATVEKNRSNSSLNMSGVSESDINLSMDPDSSLFFAAKEANSNKLLKTRKCKQCSFTSVNCKWRLMCHAQNHLNIKMYSCYLCNFKAVQLGNLRTHIRKHHPGIECEPVKSTTPEQDQQLAKFMAEEFIVISDC